MEVVVTTGYWSYKSCKVQIITTNKSTSIFYRPNALPVAQPTVWKRWGEISHSMDLLTPSSPGVFQLGLCPLIAPGYFGGGLACLSSVLWCQYPIVWQHWPTDLNKDNNTFQGVHIRCSMCLSAPQLVMLQSGGRWSILLAVGHLVDRPPSVAVS